MNKFINPTSLSQPSGFSHISISTRPITIHIAGQVSYDINGEIVGKDDILVQTKQVYQNIGKALDSVGATFDDVVKTTLYVKDLDSDKIQKIRQARTEFISTLNPPASTMVGVATLAKPDLLLEIDAVVMIEKLPTSEG